MLQIAILLKFAQLIKFYNIDLVIFSVSLNYENCTLIK